MLGIKGLSCAKKCPIDEGDDADGRQGLTGSGACRRTLAPPQVITPQPQRPAPSQALQLVTLAETVELFHSPGGEAYATVPVNDHRETWRLRSRGFRQWLAYQYFQREGRIPGTQVLQGAMEILEGEALFAGPEQAVFIRLAQHEDAIYVDLTNAMWEVIEVTATGWFERGTAIMSLSISLTGSHAPF